MLAPLMLMAALAGQSEPATLTPTEVLAKLDGIPVFVPCGPEGNPLVATEKGVSSTAVFFLRADCAAFITANKAKLPANVEPRSMGLSGLNQSGLNLMFMPIAAEEAKAKEIIAAENAAAKKADPQAKERKLSGVPLFHVMDGTRSVTVTIKESTTVPFFMSWADADKLATRVKEASKGEAVPVVHVSSMAAVFAFLQKGPAMATRPLVIVPHPDALKAD